MSWSKATPERLLDRMRESNRGGDVHLIGGPTTIETYRRLGALDTLELVVVPLLFGGGMQLTPAIGADAGLTLESSRELPGGSVELVYSCEGARSDLPERPASQR
jgi:dihydrofolate reductase